MFPFIIFNLAQNMDKLLRTTTHTKTGNNTGSYGTRTNNTTTHTKLGIAFEASKLESITLKERKKDGSSIDIRRANTTGVNESEEQSLKVLYLYC
jgi:hypothetical protein